MPAHLGAESLKKPHDIVTLRFIELVKDHGNCWSVVMLGQTQFVDSGFLEVFIVFGWVCSSVFINEPGFGRV